MKKWSLIILIILSSIQLFAQSEKKDRQIGIDMTSFVLRFFSKNPVNINTDIPSTIFLYRKGRDGKNWRFSLGGNINYRTTTTEDEEKFMFIRVTPKIGKERYHDVSEKWKIYYGWECGFNFEYWEQTSSIGNKNINRKTNSNFDALFGVQYKLKNRLSIFTETKYGLNFEANSSEFIIYTLKTQYQPPISVFLNYQF